VIVTKKESIILVVTSFYFDVGYLSLVDSVGFTKLCSARSYDVSCMCAYGGTLPRRSGQCVEMLAIYVFWEIL
jgi:hypothetical protein